METICIICLRALVIEYLVQGDRGEWYDDIMYVVNLMGTMPYIHALWSGIIIEDLTAGCMLDVSQLPKPPFDVRGITCKKSYYSVLLKEKKSAIIVIQCLI